MKFIIDNYSHSNTTQPMCFHRGFIDEGHESYILDMTQVSVYDVMDVHNPDVVLSSASRLSRALLSYLINDKSKKLILNIDNVPKTDLEQMISYITQNDVSLLFLLSSDYSLPSKIGKVNVVKILPCVDTYMVQKLDFDYNIDIGYIIDNMQDEIGFPTTFHVISTNPDLINKVDISMNCLGLRSIYDRYNTIVLNDMKSINQVFFDGLAYGKQLYYTGNYEQEKINNILKLDVDLRYDSDQKTTDFSEIKKVIMEKHTGQNRTRQLLSQINGNFKV